MILLVTGSRDIIDTRFVIKCLDDIRKQHYVEKIIHGGAKGVDSSVNFYCVLNGIECEAYKPDWFKHGKSAGPIRNKEMVDKCDKGIAIWDGESKGTKNCIKNLIEQKKLLKIFYV